MSNTDENQVIVVHNTQYLDAALKQVAGGEAAKNQILSSYGKEKLSRANALYILWAAFACAIVFCAIGLAALLARGDIEFRLRWFNQWIGGSDASIIEVLPDGGVQTLIPVGELPAITSPGGQPFVLTPVQPGTLPNTNENGSGYVPPDGQVIPGLDTEIGLIQFPELQSDENIPVVVPGQTTPNESGAPIINEIVNLFTSREFTTNDGRIITLTAGHLLRPGARRREFHRAYCYTAEKQMGGAFQIDLGDLQNVDADPVMDSYPSGSFLTEGEFKRAFDACPWIK